MMTLEFGDAWMLHHKVFAFVVSLLVFLNLCLGLVLSIVETLYYYKHM